MATVKTKARVKVRKKMDPEELIAACRALCSIVPTLDTTDDGLCAQVAELYFRAAAALGQLDHLAARNYESTLKKLALPRLGRGLGQNAIHADLKRKLRAHLAVLLNPPQGLGTIYSYSLPSLSALLVPAPSSMESVGRHERFPVKKLY